MTADKKTTTAGPAPVIHRSKGPMPHVAIGTGAPLVFLPGLLPDAGVDSDMLEKIAVRSVKPFAAGRQVLFLNRRRGLPRGMTMAQIAREHAEAIRATFTGPVDVVGLSTGGSIAQQLAVDHPDIIHQLVLISTACRLGPNGRALQRQVAQLVRRGAHRQAFAVLVAGLVPPFRGRLAAGAAAWLLGPRIFPHEQGLIDMATTLEAEDAFDLAKCQRPIAAPTLILAGRKDRLYSPQLFTETANLIPNSQLRIFDRRGHVSMSTDSRLPDDVSRFLSTNT